MAEKAKKDQQQQKNKKAKNNEKKKTQENGVKHLNEQQSVHNSNHVGQKKKDKNNKNNSKSPSKKKSGSSFLKRFLQITCINCVYLALLLGFLYLVDYEKFSGIRDGAGLLLNKTLSVLPAEVVTKGRETIEFFRPAGQFAVSKVSIAVNEISTFFSTNPLTKDHWTNIKEISWICSARLVDYMRTVYLQICGFCLQVKNKFIL